MTLRYAWRSLAKSPGFAAIAVVALGVGLGLSTTMFAVLDAVVHPSQPYRDPGTLFHVILRVPRHVTVPPADLFEAARGLPFVTSLAPFRVSDLMLDRGTDGREIRAARVTPAYFDIMGVRPRIGRTFVASDGEDVVVVGYALWKRLGYRRLSTDATLSAGGRTYTIIGVLPRGADHPWQSAAAWMPMTAGEAARGGMIVLRVRAGTTIQAADEALRPVAAYLTQRFGRPDQPVGLNLFPATFDGGGEQVRDIHVAMVGSALIVLLIACVNLAHLMLARGLAKRRELSLRLALGATRGAVVRQMLLESLIITAAGTALGALLTVWGADVLSNRMPPEVSWVGLVQPQLSWRVFAGAAAAATISVVLFGLVPALRVVSRIDLNEPLKDGAATTSRVRQRYSALVVAEVALALVLLMAGGLLLRTLWRLRADARAWDTSRLLRVYVMSRRGDDTTAVPVRWSEVRSTVSGAPGVTAVAIENRLAPKGLSVTAEMVGGDSTRVLNRMSLPVVSADYFGVIRLPILQGRDFEPGDAVGDGAAIIDPLAADALYPRQNPVGRMLKLGGPASDAAWVRIVGVARNPQALEGADVYREPQVWIAQESRTQRGGLIVRTERPDPAVAVDLRRRLASVPGVAGVYVQSFSYGREARLASRAFLAKVFVAMGAVALALAALGIYGVLAYAVNQRMREFAVRIALGAQPGQLFRMVLHDGAVMLLAGTGVGAFAALAASRWVDAVIEGVYRTDVWSLLMAEAVLLAIGVAASLAPALRAVKANPMDILRAV